ncbi:E3 ubiquitin-protein ligase MBR2-like [Bidens hawaiensis]|uniref:E3 ubiquitin-protein ligase MBR2-like n=1 Tax=Bidens hawaiensis TaxID=980011 RepID=UPI00404B670A
MRGQRSIFDPFPETVDLNQGSSSNTTNMDETDDWSNMLYPVERRLLNNDLSNELNFSCVNTDSHNSYPSFRSWDVGESSSRTSLQGQVSNNGQSWSNAVNQPQHQVNMQSSSSNHIPMNVNLNPEFENNNSEDDDDDDDTMQSSSFSNWGLSCKRKSLEGTSTQTLGVGSSYFPETSRSLNISSPLVNPAPVNRHEPPNTRIGVSENSPPPTSFDIRGSFLDDSINNNISSTRNATRRSNGNSSHHSSSRQLLLNEFLDRGQMGNLSNQQPPLTHVPNIQRDTHHFLWGSNIGSRNGSSSSLLRNNVQYHNFVSPSESRNLVQDPPSWSLGTGGNGSRSGGSGSAPLSSRTGRSSGNGSAPSSSRTGIGSSDGSRGFNGVWTPLRSNHATPSQQRSSEFPPWTLFPSAEVESGGHRGHFAQFSGGSSSISDDNHVQRRNHQSFSRPALLMEVPGDDWRVLTADIQGRQRLVSEIRQVLNAMRRGENLRAEDYMIFDPFINGVAELHDRHRDLRLDVDNMSYEELLALEERIGDVNTGLSEEVILKSMKQRKHIALMAILTQKLEPCCICQEDYATDDNIGSLDCGHDFHTDCIKQWLAQKNICPICKMPGLAT